MKNILYLLLLGVPALSFAQPADKYATFSAQKQSIVLRTGITMKYVDTGNPEGTPVILLHGATDTGRSFQLTIEELIRTNSALRILAPDLRGQGETTMPDAAACAEVPETCFAPANLAADVIALMNQKKIAKAHVVGHSMGSIIAQEMALTYPGRVHSLVLIGTFVNGKENPAIHDFLLATVVEGKFKQALEKRKNFHWPGDAYWISPEELGPGVTSFIRASWVTELGTDPALLNAIYPETVRVPIGAWIGIFRSLGAVDNRERIADVKVPTLVLFPLQDSMFPEPDQQQVKAALQKAVNRHGTKVIYKTYGKISLPASGQQESDLGHNLQWAAPAPVAADISAFIRSGRPEANLPYLDPQSKNRVLIEEGNDNILHFQPSKD